MQRINSSFKLQRTLPTVALSVLLGVGMMGAFAGCASESQADTSGSGTIQGEVVPTDTQQEAAPDQEQGGASLAEQDTQGTESIGDTSKAKASAGEADKSNKGEGNLQGTDGIISKDEALEIALTAADLTADDVTVTQNVLTTEDGASVYEIEFYSAEQDYDFTINSTTGAIIEQSADVIAPVVGTSTRTATSSELSAGAIDEAEAKSIAAERAGIAESDATYTSVQLEQEDGMLVYDVTLVSGSTEYEVVINAETGTVIEYETDSVLS